MKRALTLGGQPHETISHIEEGAAGGWRVVTFASGAVERMTARELQQLYTCDPFRNVNPVSWR